jgi:predicted choloylglycine hydrolase
MVGREDGMNQTGLAIAGSEVPSKNVKPGIIYTLLIRGVLDRCSTVDEAVAILTKAKHARAMKNEIAHRSGKFAYVETTPHATKAKNRIYHEGSRTLLQDQRGCRALSAGKRACSTITLR